jgi:hypothetical protein
MTNSNYAGHSFRYTLYSAERRFNMDLKSKIGTAWSCDFPFVNVSTSTDIALGRDIRWCPGCRIDHEAEYMDYGDAYFECDAIGKRFIKLMSIAEMPARFDDRIVYQVWYILPTGTDTGKKIKVAPMKRFSEMLDGFRNKMPVHIDGDEWTPTPCVELAGSGA